MYMHIFSKLSLLATGLVVASATSIAVVAAAPNSHASAATTNSQATTRLAENKLKLCQKREVAIDHILTRIGDRGQKQIDLFSTIATRVETFYTTKGKVLTNYNALVADVSANKIAAQTAVDAVKSETVTFKCDGTDPKGAVSSFKVALKAEIAALKAYKTSVRNLIVGVKSVQGTTTSTIHKTTTPGQQ